MIYSDFYKHGNEVLSMKSEGKSIVNTPTVSVIVPTYNRANLVVRAIQSVLKQTYTDFELIIVDDASTDNTEEVVKTFGDPRIRYIRHDQNRRGSVARNTGIKKARGAYIAFLDSDDEWLPEKLEKQLAHFQGLENRVGGMYCRASWMDDSTGFLRAQNAVLHRGNIWLYLLKGWCPAITSSVVIRRECFDSCGGFNESLPSFQDYDLWLRIAQDYHFEFVDEPLVIVHQHTGPQVSKDFAPRMKGLEMFLEEWGPIIKEHAGEQTYTSIRKQHLRRTYFKAVRSDLVASRRWSAWKNYLKLIALGQVSLRLFIKILIVFIGGSHLLNRIKPAWKNLKKVYKRTS